MNLYTEKFARNRLTKKQQDILRASSFAIVGLGGTGGFILENLLRMGAENIIVFDNDRFELSNFNRQTLATDGSLDTPKTHAAAARAKAINSGAEIDSRGLFGEGSDLGGPDIVLDGSDNIKTKLLVSRSARAEKIPYVFCSAQSSRGIVTVFTIYRFEKAFHLPKEDALEKYRSCSDILCPAASLAGTLAASQAVNVLLEKPFIKAPQALFFDLFRKEIFWRGRLG